MVGPTERQLRATVTGAAKFWHHVFMCENICEIYPAFCRSVQKTYSVYADREIGPFCKRLSRVQVLEVSK